LIQASECALADFAASSTTGAVSTTWHCLAPIFGDCSVMVVSPGRNDLESQELPGIELDLVYDIPRLVQMIRLLFLC
jgi:hypothetical protein